MKYKKINFAFFLFLCSRRTFYDALQMGIGERYSPIKKKDLRIHISIVQFPLTCELPIYTFWKEGRMNTRGKLKPD